jgi:hypothetical protein
VTGREEAERARRVLLTVHLAFFASVPVYGIVVWIARGVPGARVASVPSAALRVAVPMLALLALAEFFAVSWYAQKVLDAPPGPGKPRRPPLARVQTSFTLRFAAAEAIAIYGLVLGFLGCAAWQVALFFAGAMGGLASAAPGRTRFALCLAAADPDWARRRAAEPINAR